MKIFKAVTAVTTGLGILTSKENVKNPALIAKPFEQSYVIVKSENGMKVSPIDNNITVTNVPISEANEDLTVSKFTSLLEQSVLPPPRFSNEEIKSDITIACIEDYNQTGQKNEFFKTLADLDNWIGSEYGNNEEFAKWVDLPQGRILVENYIKALKTFCELSPRTVLSELNRVFKDLPMGKTSNEKHPMFIFWKSFLLYKMMHGKVGKSTFIHSFLQSMFMSSAILTEFLTSSFSGLEMYFMEHTKLIEGELQNIFMETYNLMVKYLIFYISKYDKGSLTEDLSSLVKFKPPFPSIFTSKIVV